MKPPIARQCIRKSRESRHLPLGWSSKQLICSQTPIGGPGHSKMHQENFTNTFKASKIEQIQQKRSKERAENGWETT
jgi:hypothetical protein